LGAGGVAKPNPASVGALSTANAVPARSCLVLAFGHHSGMVKMQTDAAASNVGPLAGVKVLELGQLIAGPFAAKTLADFGADVVKVEPPGAGDPLRQWRLLKDGTSVWWQVQSRNKRLLVLDLRQLAAQETVRLLADECDVLIENFRPGAMEGFGLDPALLMQRNPRLVVLRISGYGQTGPYRDKPGFGVVAEAWAACAISRPNRAVCRCAWG
jgi:formyl-CoA transferase